LGASLPGSFPNPALRMQTSADSWQPEEASLESCCSASSAHGTARTDAQRLGLLACLATSNLKRRLEIVVSLSGSFHSPALKMRTSADSWQPEGASLESCCSASSAHGTARTEAQKLGLLACLDTSNFKRRLEMVVSLLDSFHSPALKIRTSADSRQPEGASLESCCSASSAHLALLAQRHRDWGCLLVLPPQTSNVSYVVLARRIR